ncbi:MAG: hypothetical protein FWF97_02140, partial [Alphaproteobacteria bacterium]|nr:hypothetical protein [Alphaproteobacteria bacterium]
MNPKKDKYDEEFLKAQKYMLDRVCQDVGESAKYYKKLCKSTTASTPLQRMYMNMFCNLSNSADAIYFLILSKKGREALIVAGHMIEGLALFLYAKRYRKALKYYDYMSIKCLQLHYMEEVIYGNVGPVQNEKCRDNDIEFIKKYGAKFLKSKTG